MPNDFNGDGYGDLAIGIPAEIVSGQDEAGAVQVLYGSSRGLKTEGGQHWTQASPGVPGDPRQIDRFGRTVASGDHNGDGYAELIVGVPNDQVPGTATPSHPRGQRWGTVTVVYGSRTGLGPKSQRLTMSSLAPGGADYLSFGHQLATGDVNGDGRYDLAIGYLGEGVILVYGTKGELGTADSLILSASTYTGRCAALVAGDLDGDGFADLARGCTSTPDRERHGVLDIWYGGPTGINGQRSQQWTATSPGLAAHSRPGDDIGSSLAIGDLNADGIDDLAIGAGPPEAYEENGGADTRGGSVIVLYGSTGGVTGAGSSVLTAPDDGQALWAQSDDFGLALAAGDVNGDGADDLAIGSPRTGLSRGVVFLIKGGRDGVTTAGYETWSQDAPGVASTAERANRFGEALSIGDFDGSGHADLAIGSPGEAIGDPDLAAGCGRVTVLYGTTAGLTADGSQVWDRNSPGIAGKPSARDQFGARIGRHDGTGGPRW